MLSSFASKLSLHGHEGVIQSDCTRLGSPLPRTPSVSLGISSSTPAAKCAASRGALLGPRLKIRDRLRVIALWPTPNHEGKLALHDLSYLRRYLSALSSMSLLFRMSGGIVPPSLRGL